jgi:hypothetical protein
MHQKVMRTGSLSQQPFRLGDRLIDGESTRTVTRHLIGQIAFDL